MNEETKKMGDAYRDALLIQAAKYYNAINSERDFRKTQQKISNNIENSLQMIA